MDVQNKALIEAFLEKLIKLVMTIAGDDLENFRDLTSNDKNNFILRPLIQFFSKSPSIFRKQLSENLTREFNEKVI